jgi:serine/threonine protein phosphatase 1
MAYRSASATPSDTAIYAIGDIHGRLDLLLQLQEQIANDAARHPAKRRLLVYLGDYVSRGPDSRGVVERVRTWQPEGFERVILRGNHEDLLLRFAGGEWKAGRHWFDYGGLDTLAAYGIDIADRAARDEASVTELGRCLAAALPLSHLEFFNTLQINHRAGGYFFSHGGIRPGVALDAQSPHDCMWIRKTFLDSSADHGAVVVHGHSICREPEIRRNRIGIDTGAYRSGVLTCVVLEGSAIKLLQTGTEERNRTGSP